MSTPSPAKIGFGVTLMVRPRLWLGAALTPLATTTATSGGTPGARTGRRKRLGAPSPGGWVGAPAGSRLPTRRWRLDVRENTPPNGKLRFGLDFRRRGLFYPRGGRW